MNQVDFLGKGFSYPFRMDTELGQMATSEGVALVEESIRILLGTKKGERVMRPDFGADLDSIVFSPIQANTFAMIQKYIKDCLDKWEPRIEVKEVTVTPDANEGNKIIIDLEYEILSHNSIHNMVYPFYLEGSK